MAEPSLTTVKESSESVHGESAEEREAAERRAAVAFGMADDVTPGEASAPAPHAAAAPAEVGEKAPAPEVVEAS